MAMITPASPTRLFTRLHVPECVPLANSRLPVPMVTGCIQTCMRSTSCSRSSVWIRVPLPQTIMSGPSSAFSFRSATGTSPETTFVFTQSGSKGACDTTYLVASLKGLAIALFESCFGQKPAKISYVVCQPINHRLGQELERHRLAQHKIVRAKYLAHAAATEQRNDAVALPNQHAGREAPFGAGMMRCRPEGRRVPRRRIRGCVRRGDRGRGRSVSAGRPCGTCPQRTSALRARRPCPLYLPATLLASFHLQRLRSPLSYCLVPESAWAEVPPTAVQVDRRREVLSGGKAIRNEKSQSV